MPQTEHKGWNVMDPSTTDPEFMHEEDKDLDSLSKEDILVPILNVFEFLSIWNPRRFSNFRWANITRDAEEFGQQISQSVSHKVYGRCTLRYKFHKLQRFHTALRRFDVIDSLAERLSESGNYAFYNDVCGQVPSSKSFPVDLTKISDISSLRTSAEYLYKDISARKGHKAGELARKFYLRGFSRKICAKDRTDWYSFRHEITGELCKPTTLSEAESEDSSDTLLVAVSYKGNNVHIIHKQRDLDQNFAPMGKPMVVQEEKQMTLYFTDDFRWPQLMRSCMELAKHNGVRYVRVWIDRLMQMGLPPEEKEEKRSLKWEDYGLFAYAVCPVVRLYEQNEPEYNTLFWRKMEAVMGVAGKGLVADDYMLRTYDVDFYYGPKLYKRLGDGLALIGGTGIYIRSVSLALATAILTDGVSVKEANEDSRTRQSVPQWKSWALRTISEGAYSEEHSMMVMEDSPITIGLSHFKVIAFWESMISRSEVLQGSSYLDMSIDSSSNAERPPKWDGIQEWLGMVKGSFMLQDREAIMEFLNKHVLITSYAAPSGHFSSLLQLSTANGGHKRTLAVELSRFSSLESGYVTAVAEATGLHSAESLLPWYLVFRPNPNEDQKVELENGKTKFKYKNIAVDHAFRWPLLIFTILFTVVYAIVANPFSQSSIENDPNANGSNANGSIPGGASAQVVKLILLQMLIWLQSSWVIPTIVRAIWSSRTKWPWKDESGLGEAVFYNVKNHALFESGIKSYYRPMKSIEYADLRWE